MYKINQYIVVVNFFFMLDAAYFLLHFIKCSRKEKISTCWLTMPASE